MLSRLLKNIPKPQLLGIRICTIGFAVVAVGFLIVFCTRLIGNVAIEEAGVVLTYLGFVIGVSGMAIHFVLLLKRHENRRIR